MFPNFFSLRKSYPKAETDQGKPDSDLPAHPEKRTQVPEQTIARILVAEDSPTNQKVISGILTRLNISVDMVSNGIEAIAALRTKQYDLVLMDILMPEMDGYEATIQIRNPESGVLNHRIPVIAMTAHTKKEDLDKCLDVGMNDYLLKPVSPAALSELFRHQLAERSIQPADTLTDDPDALPVFDFEGVSDRLMDDTELIIKILNVFFSDTKSKIASLKEALSRKDTKMVEMIGHTMKGAASNAGLERFRSIAAKIEFDGRSGNLSDVASRIQRLETEFSAAADEVRKTLPAE